MAIVFAIISKGNPAAAAKTSYLTIVSIFSDTGNLETGQRLDITDECPIRGRHHHDLVFRIK